MRVLFCTTSSNNTEPFMASLDYLGEHEINVFRYDSTWNEVAAAAAHDNPEVQQQLALGMWPPPEIFDAIRNRVRRDDELITTVEKWQPDVVIYISAWEGLFVPHNDTLKHINSKVPVVHFLCDAADPPWWPQLAAFERDKVFSLTVTIDGAYVWPGSERWSDALGHPAAKEWMDPTFFGDHEEYGDSELKPLLRRIPYVTDVKGPLIGRALTLLTPLDPRAFEGLPATPAYRHRPFTIAYAGNFGGWTRSRLVEYVQKRLPELAVRQRDNSPSSYRLFCDFLRFSKVLISVPFTGSGAAQHVKGRILEGGYAGCCLLEWKNDATRSFFEPRRDYWEYDSVEECAEMAEWLSKHPRICEEMAENLHRRVTQEHNPRVFWGKVFNALPGVGVRLTRMGA